jgi:hypothetical protein
VNFIAEFPSSPDLLDVIELAGLIVERLLGAMEPDDGEPASSWQT